MNLIKMIVKTAWVALVAILYLVALCIGGIYIFIVDKLWADDVRKTLP